MPLIWNARFKGTKMKLKTLNKNMDRLAKTQV